MIIEVNPYFLALALIGVEALALATLIWRRARGRRGVIPFTAMMAGLSIWALAYGLEVLIPGLPAKLFWSRVAYTGIVAVPLTAFLFSLDYTGVDRWLTRRNLILLCVLPAITIIIVWTNDLHHWFYTSVTLVSGSVSDFTAAHGFWFWVHVAYSYLLMLFGLGQLARAMVRSPDLYRGQVATLLAGMLAPWIGNAIYIFDLSPFGNLDITPFFFAFTGLMLALSLTRYRFFDIVPAARDMVIESMREAVIVLDNEGRIVDVNPAARGMLGQASDKAIGKPIGEVIPDRHDLIERFRDQPEVRTELALPVNGQDRTLELVISTLQNRQGAATGRLIVVRDITESKLIEKKLAEARDQALEAARLRSRILAVVSHELRTPLSAIIGYADMMRAGAHGPLNEAQKAALGRMSLNAEHLNELVNDLLDQGQIEQGRMTLHIAPFEPSRLLENIEASMATKARQKGLKLVTEIAPDAPGVVATDLSRLTQVITNLVGNALKFTVEGEIRVRVAGHDEKRWQVVVSDTGPGIAPDNQRRIFDPFWQVDNPETREHKGVGLGLSIAKQMAELLGGSIELESQPGKGTSFHVMLPESVRGEEKTSEKVSGVGG